MASRRIDRDVPERIEAIFGCEKKKSAMYMLQDSLRQRSSQVMSRRPVGFGVGRDDDAGSMCSTTIQ